MRVGVRGGVGGHGNLCPLDFVLRGIGGLGDGGNRGRERFTGNGSCRRFPRKIQTHLGEPLEPPSVSPARDPPSDWAELVQAHDDRDVYQASPAEMTAIDIRSL